MFRRAQFFKMSYPLELDFIKDKFRNVDSKSRRVIDKNTINIEITLDCSFNQKRENADNYQLGASIEYQFHPRKNTPWLNTREFVAFMFFPRNKLLVVLGRDEALTEAIKVVSNILYDNTDTIKPFNSVMFEKQSLVDTIGIMKNNDSTGASWCDEHNAIHRAEKYEGRKTKTNFSLGPNNCVLEDEEALAEIENATSISPKYRFKKCSELNAISYDRPKTISFNGEQGVISISISQGFENWDRFISKFILKNVECI